MAREIYEVNFRLLRLDYKFLVSARLINWSTPANDGTRIGSWALQFRLYFDSRDFISWLIHFQIQKAFFGRPSAISIDIFLLFMPPARNNRLHYFYLPRPWRSPILCGVLWTRKVAPRRIPRLVLNLRIGWLLLHQRDEVSIHHVGCGAISLCRSQSLVGRASIGSRA